MLTKNFLPHKEEILLDGYLFQLDNATVHTANITLQRFEDEGIQIFEVKWNPFLIDIIIRLQT